MSLAAAFTILFGAGKKLNTTKRISLSSAIILATQAIYIVAINTINFTLINIFVFYLIIGLFNIEVPSTSVASNLAKSRSKSSDKDS